MSPFDLDTFPNDYLPERKIPDRVGWSDIDRIRQVTGAAASTENLHGGGNASETSARHLRCFAPLLRGRATEKVRKALFEAVGNLSGVAAYSAYDIAEYTEAERSFRFALWCADIAGSWDLCAATLADMARKSAYVGNTDGALSLIELAAVRSDRLTATTRAMIAALRAQFLSGLDRTDEAISEVTRADEHFAAREPAADPPWMCYYDHAEHLGSTGKALIPAALARKRLDLAAPRIEQAVHLQGKKYRRSRAFSLTRLAAVTMRIGDPRQAACLGLEAVATAQGINSHRIRHELTFLADAAQPHRRIPEVADLHRALAPAGTPP